MKTNPWYYVGKVLWVASLLSLSLYLALAYEDFYVVCRLRSQCKH